MVAVDQLLSLGLGIGRIAAGIGDNELDLKALAAASGNRKIQLVPVKELQALTGYIRGGVTALAGKKDYPVFVDETIELFDVISISAGIRAIAKRSWRSSHTAAMPETWSQPSTMPSGYRALVRPIRIWPGSRASFAPA